MGEHCTVKIYIKSKQIFMINPTISIKKSAGNHTKVTVQGIVQSESYQLVEGIEAMAELEIQMDGKKEPLFCGLTIYSDVQARESGGEQYQELFLEAMSYTCLLDKKKEYVAFQKRSATYQEILNIVLAGYQNVKYLFGSQMSVQSINQFAVQYEETDWQFIARLASRAGVPLIASHSAKGIHFTIGAFWGEKSYKIPESEEEQAKVIQDEFYYIKWRTDNPAAPVFEIGDCIFYQGFTGYVKEAELVIKDYILSQDCVICRKDQFYISEIQNPFITGLSLPGCVKEVKGNQLKVTLDIDAIKDTECWFVYSTFYSTFYCMPEEGDRINLYFPNHTEDDAFVLNSVRSAPGEITFNGGETSRGASAESVGGTTVPQGSSSPSSNGATASGTASGGQKQEFDFDTMAQNPNVKILCSRNGRMVILDDENGSISIVCDNGTNIVLSEKGITIQTEERIHLNAAKEIKMKAGKTMRLSAEEEITIKCKETGICVKPEEIKLNGNDIKMNEE